MSAELAAQIAAAVETQAGDVAYMLDLLQRKANQAELARLIDALDPIMRLSAANQATVFLLLAALLRNVIPADGTESIWLLAFVSQVMSLRHQRGIHDGPVPVH